MKRISILLIVVLVFGLLVSCASAKKEPEILTNVVVAVGETKTGVDTLEDAVALVSAGETAVITIQADITVNSEIVIENKTITITNKDGLDVVINDGTTANGEAAVAAGYKVADMIIIKGTGELTLEGNKTGSLTIKGAPVSGAGPIARSLIILPKSDPGKLFIKAGVTITKQYSTGGAGVIRNYGYVQIEEGVKFIDNTIEKSNGCVMFIGGAGEAVINGGEFINNNAGPSNGGTIQVSNDAEVSKLTINGGTFTGNIAARGAVVNSYAKSVVTINGGTFTGNTGTNEQFGAAVYCLGTFTINGGTFKDNGLFDVYKAADTVTISDKAEIAKLGQP